MGLEMIKVSNDWSLGCVKPRDAMPGTGVRTLTQGQGGRAQMHRSHITLSHCYNVTL